VEQAVGEWIAKMLVKISLEPFTNLGLISFWFKINRSYCFSGCSDAVGWAQ
jgi:hypothetical protein